jgi:reverse gyrase
VKPAARSRRGPKGAAATAPDLETDGAERASDAKPARKTRSKRAAKPAASGASADGKALVIVESPAKSRTLNKFLGRNFSVLASNGHIMDLPKSELGVDVDHSFEPRYVPIRGKSLALAKIKTAARTAARIYLAPDPDREGEAIAWHLAGVLKSAKRPIRRLTFNEITERAVKQAL